jgi:Ankyrin repeats (3 copies)
MNNLGWEVKRKALIILLTTDVPSEQMIMPLIETSDLSYLIIYRRKITFAGVTGYGIHWAAIRGYDRLMQHMLQSDNCETNVKSSCGTNALHFASKICRCNIVERLLRDGRIAPDVKTTAGYSNTYFAIESCHSCCLKRLLNDPRSDPNAVICPEGLRAVHFACIVGYGESLKVILQDVRIDPNAIWTYYV